MVLRPNYVVLGYDQGGRLVLHGLYCSARKAERAYRRLQRPDKDSGYTLLLEDGRFKTVYGKGLSLTSKVTCLGPLWTKRTPWRQSFHGIGDDEFKELAETQRLPESILRSIAHYERDYLEGNDGIRWEAFVRSPLPVPRVLLDSALPAPNTLPGSACSDGEKARSASGIWPGSPLSPRLRWTLRFAKPAPMTLAKRGD